MTGDRVQERRPRPASTAFVETYLGGMLQNPWQDWPPKIWLIFLYAQVKIYIVTIKSDQNMSLLHLKVGLGAFHESE